MTLAQGAILHHRYRIVRLVGQGGFGAVYRGWDTALDRPVAVKENFDTGPESQHQFEREAKLLAGLRHPNLPVVIDHFVLPGQGQYLVMDFVEGKSLAAIVAERAGPVDEAEALPWIRQVCDALTYLHTRTPPIIHRDIKPENIIITADGRAMLVDFGISKLYDPGKGTTIGAKAVTPGYSPPEQYGRGRTDPRSDVYALGATFYTLLTGRTPPEAPDLSSGADTLAPPRQVNPAVSQATSAAIMAAMTLSISQRLASAAGLAGELPATLPPRPVAPPIVPPTVPLAAAGGKRGVSVWGRLAAVAALLALAIWAGVALDGRNGSGREPEPQAGDIRVVNRGGVDVEQVYVPAGSFRMGSEDGAGDERPVHEVTLDAFWIDRTEVTNAQYAACVTAGACALPADRSSYSRLSYYGNPKYAAYPVIAVSWEDARAFSEWAGGQLPTEAQWEYAARGPESRVYPWGNAAPTCHLLNYVECVGDTNEVGSYPDGASWVGALDMAGNVLEWVNDWYDATYYLNSPGVNPMGPSSGQGKALRGGSGGGDVQLTRATVRDGRNPHARNSFLGFRVVELLSDPGS